MEKTTGSRKKAKGAPITLTAGAGENTLSQDSEKCGLLQSELARCRGLNST